MSIRMSHILENLEAYQPDELRGFIVEFGKELVRLRIVADAYSSRIGEYCKATVPEGHWPGCDYCIEKKLVPDCVKHRNPKDRGDVVSVKGSSNDR